MTSYSIVIDNLSKQYSKKNTVIDALKSVSLQIERKYFLVFWVQMVQVNQL